VELPLLESSRISKVNMKKVLAYLEELEYGSITLVVHDGKVVLVEKIEKIKI
jgi:hypothetical protein